MERLIDYDLPKYIKDDLLELLEEYTNLFEMPADALNELVNNLWAEANNYTRKAARLKNRANAINKYCKVKYYEE